MDEAFLCVEMLRSRPYVIGVLGAHADELLKSLEGSQTTRGRD